MTSNSLRVLADTHVHIYPFMSVGRLLDAASTNTSRLAAQGPDEHLGILLVADPVGVQGYERLLHADGRNDYRHWSPEYADIGCAVLQRPDGARIAAVKGQQLITHERLEVLAVGHKTIPSGLSLYATVDRITADGGLSIIPWGAGKWLGRRGRLLTDLITSEERRPDIMLADNGLRPWCWTRVPQFGLAAERGMRVLAGTDLLPLAGEERRVGSYGVRLRIDNPGSAPIADVFRKQLMNAAATIEIVGKTMSFSRFASSQLRLRLQQKASRA